MRAFASLAVLSVSLSLNAFAGEVTHNWTIRVGGTEYGLQGLKDYTPPHYRTEICFRSGSFNPIVDLHIYAVGLIFLAIGSVPPLVVAYFYARYRRRHRNAANPALALLLQSHAPRGPDR